MKLLVSVLVLFCFCTSFAEDLSDLKKKGFEGNLFGLSWGDDINESALSTKGCSSFQSSPQLLQNWSTPDWCEKLQRTRLMGATDECRSCPKREVCAKKHWKDRIEYCYTGANFMFEDRNREHPSPMVAHFLLKLKGIEVEKVPGMDNETHPGGKELFNQYGFRLFPIAFEGKGSTRYLVSWLGKLVGFASSSEIPDKLDPKYFLIQTEKKYGEATTKKVFSEPLQERYSECWIWNSTKDKFAQVTCIIPKSLSNTERARIDTLFFEKMTNMDLAQKLSAEMKNREKVGDKKQKEKTGKEAQDVDF